MSERLNYAEASPQGFAAMRALEAHVRQSGLDHRLLELVKTRASQLNGCAFCLDMHTKDARAAGETEQRLYALSAWRETSFYTPIERAALAWTEAVTRLRGDEPVSDTVYAEARAHFDERQLVDLTLAIVAINGWNRLSIAFGKEPGTYQPPARSQR
jgi:AhpD family alkylhydroperoxidase